VVSLGKGTLLPHKGSMLLLGSPESRAMLQSLLNIHCGDHLQLRDEGVTLGATAYDGPGIAVLASCHRHNQPGSVITVVYAVTPQAATTVARLLFFYGWNSYVVFKDGAVILRGEWATQNDRMEVSLDEHAVIR
jgi:aminopeptidase N